MYSSELALMMLALLVPAMCAGDAVPRWDAAVPDATKPAAGLPLLTNKSASLWLLRSGSDPAQPL